MVEVDPWFERPTNITSTTEFFFEYPNDLLLGAWGYMLLTIIFSITFLSTMKFGVRRPFAAASFMTFVCAVFLVPLKAVGSEAVLVTATLLGLSIIINRGDRAV